MLHALEFFINLHLHVQHLADALIRSDLHCLHRLSLSQAHRERDSVVMHLQDFSISKSK